MVRTINNAPVSLLTLQLIPQFPDQRYAIPDLCIHLTVPKRFVSVQLTPLYVTKLPSPIVYESHQLRYFPFLVLYL